LEQSNKGKTAKALAKNTPPPGLSAAVRRMHIEESTENEASFTFLLWIFANRL
jgi:hypothetical protein